MPLYEYELIDDDCVACGKGFTLRRPISAPDLSKCPACKKPVRKIISSFSTPTKLKPLSISDAKNAGFTVLKKTGTGEYETQEPGGGALIQAAGI
jgi:putative FmdB family regulatory protein